MATLLLGRAGERPGVGVGHVVQFLDRAHDPVAGGRCGRVVAGQDPGDGRDGHAGPGGHLADRGPPPAARGLARPPRHRPPPHDAFLENGYRIDGCARACQAAGQRDRRAAVRRDGARRHGWRRAPARPARRPGTARVTRSPSTDRRDGLAQRGGIDAVAGEHDQRDVDGASAGVLGARSGTGWRSTTPNALASTARDRRGVAEAVQGDARRWSARPAGSPAPIRCPVWTAGGWAPASA